MTQPWSNQASTLIVLESDVAGFSGLFIYAGPPAAGNLIQSVAAAAGTDPQGNAYLAGTVTYFQDTTISANWFAYQLLGGSTGIGPFIQIWTATSQAGPWANTLGGHQLYQLFEVGFSDGVVRHVQALDQWAGITVPAGWTDQTATGSGFRYLPDLVAASASGGGVGSIRMYVNMKAPGAGPADGTTVGTVPASATPAAAAGYVVLGTVTTTGGKVPYFQIDTAGNIKCFGIAANAVVQGTGVYALD